MTERDKISVAEQISLEEVAEAFQAVIDKQQAGYDGQPRRTPIRALRIWRVFDQHKYDEVSLEEMADAFADTLDPRKSASSAISWINRSFKALRMDLKIGSSTVYRLRYRSK